MKFVLEARARAALGDVGMMREKFVLHVIVSLNVLLMNPYVPRSAFPAEGPLRYGHNPILGHAPSC